MADEPKVLTKTEARSGSTPHIVRYVLMASLVLVVIGMVWAFVVSPKGTQDGATTSADPGDPAATTASPAPTSTP